METFIKKYKGNICGRVFLQQICRLKKTVFFVVKCSSNSGHLQIISEIVSKKIQVQISAIQKNTNLAKLFRSTLFRHICDKFCSQKSFMDQNLKSCCENALFVYHCQLLLLSLCIIAKYGRKLLKNHLFLDTIKSHREIYPKKS